MMKASELIEKLAESKTGKEKLRALAAIAARHSKGRNCSVEELLPLMAAEKAIPPGTIAKAIMFAEIPMSKVNAIAKADWQFASRIGAIKASVETLKHGRSTPAEDYLAEAEKKAGDEQKRLEEDYMEGRTDANRAEEASKEGKTFKGTARAKDEAAAK